MPRARHLLTLLAFLLALPLPSLAQSPDATKIGAINLSYVARTSKAGKAALARIEDVGRQRNAEVEIKAADLQRKQAELQKTAIGMTERSRADLQRTFEKARLDFDRLQQDAQKEIQDMQAQFEVDLRAQLAPVIDEVSKEKGLQFVFGLEQAAIVWWSPAVDISDEVVKRLDAAVK
jgi:outer membrane protein